MWPPGLGAVERAPRNEATVMLYQINTGWQKTDEKYEEVERSGEQEKRKKMRDD